MPRNLRRWQGGISLLNLLILIPAAILLVTVGLKLLPVYMESMKVNSVLQSLHDETDLDRMAKSELKKIILRRLSVNDVANVDSSHIKIDREPGSVKVNIAWEVRIPMMSNLDVIAHFDKHYATTMQ